MIISKLIIFLGAITLFGSTVCHAQLGGAAPLPKIEKPTGPSLEETTQWITQKFESLPPVFTAHDHNLQGATIMSFDKCDFTAVYYEIGSFSISYVPLNSMDIDTIKTFSSDISDEPEIFAGLGMMSLGRKETVRKRYLTSKERDDLRSNNKISKDLIEGIKSSISPYKFYPIVYDNKLLFYLPDMEVAERIGSAFKHAISLCQKMRAQENSEQKTKPKELF